MDKVLVINLTNITQHVGVIHADGRKDDVQIMLRKRVELRVGMTVDPTWLGRNPGCVKVVKPQVTSPTVVAARKEPVVPTVAMTVGDLPASTETSDVTVADLEPAHDEVDPDEGDA